MGVRNRQCERDRAGATTRPAATAEVEALHAPAHVVQGRCRSWSKTDAYEESEGTALWIEHRECNGGGCWDTVPRRTVRKAHIVTQGQAEAGFTGWVSVLARTHRRGLASVARSEGLGSEDALDAVQKAFRTLLLLPQARSLVEFPEDSAKVLAVLVRNAARNMRRRRHRVLPHEPLPGEPDLEADELADPGPRGRERT